MPIRKSLSNGIRSYTIYNGTTNASGDYTVVYPAAYLTTPAVIPVLKAATANQIIRVTANTATGFTVKVEQRNSVNISGTDVLLAGVVNVSGANVQVVVLT